MSESGQVSPKKNILFSISPHSQFLTYKRRLSQKLLLKLGKTIESHNEEYETRSQNFIKFQKNMLDIKVCMEKQRQALVSFSGACANLGSNVFCLAESKNIGKNGGIEFFCQAMGEISSKKVTENNLHTADAVFETVIRCVAKKIADMEIHKRKIAAREEIKLDYDSYVRKIKQMSLGKVVNAEKLKKKQCKMNLVKERLEKITIELFEVFAKYESERDTSSFLVDELEMIREVLFNFFQRGMAATNFNTLKAGVNTEDLNNRRDEIFAEMKSKGSIKESKKFKASHQVDKLEVDTAVLETKEIEVLREKVLKPPNIRFSLESDKSDTYKKYTVSNKLDFQKHFESKNLNEVNALESSISLASPVKAVCVNDYPIPPPPPPPSPSSVVDSLSPCCNEDEIHTPKAVSSSTSIVVICHPGEIPPPPPDDSEWAIVEGC